MTIDSPVAAQELSQPDLEKIVARAQKILAMAKPGSGATEEEADTAMRRVQEMMAAYNLDLATIEAASASKHLDGAVERVQEEITGKTRYLWQRQLARYVAEANFCFHLIGTERIGGYWCRRGSTERVPENTWGIRLEPRDGDIWVESKRIKKHIFVGRKGNVITAQLMYHYLTQTVEDSTPIKDNKDRLSNFAMSFKAGCADRLCERLAERREDLIATHDARVKAEQAAAVAAFEQRRAEKAARRTLAAHRPSEAQAAFAQATDDAIDARRPARQAIDPEHPELDPDATPWMPEGDEAPDEPEPGTALVLMSMYDESESDANIEHYRGLAPGTLARWRAKEAEEERAWEAAQAERAAQAELEAVEAPIREETERERKLREKREAREFEARRRRWAREDKAAEAQAVREYYKYNRSAYAAGQKKGNSIGLDTQVKRGAEAKSLRGG